MPSADAVARELEAVTDGDVNATQVGGGQWAMDFRLPVADDAPFSSSLSFDAHSEQIIGAAMRFPPSLYDVYSDDELDAKFETLLERSNPPPGGLWHHYIRGDAHETGPHIISPGDFTAVDPEAFADWLRRLLITYADIFGDGPAGGTGAAAATAVDSGGAVTNIFDDEAICFRPPHSKADADYRRPDDDDFDTAHDRCGSCVHYIEGGGCHFVEGSIAPEAYCTEFYADYGVFAHDHGDRVEVNAELVGPEFDFDQRDVDDFLGELEERLQQRRRERQNGGKGGNPNGEEAESGPRLY